MALVWILGIIFGAFGVAVKFSPWWLSLILTVVLFASGIWFWRQLDKIQVETVVIGASNVRDRRLGRKTAG